MRILRQAKEKINVESLKYKFYVFDVETQEGKNETALEPIPENFVFGVLYGYNSQKVFYSIDEFKEEIKKSKYKGKYLFAHNAEFDLLTLFGNIYIYIDNAAIFNGKFILAKYENITFGDSMNIYPTSVEKIGKLIGLNKMTNKKIKKGKLTRLNITDQDIEYCITDCRIVFKALQRIFEMIGNIKLTLPSLAMYDFRKNYLSENIEFSELVDEFYESYYGGRTEAFRIGKVDAKVYDVNSMYPYAMLTTTFPDIKHLKKEVKVDVKFLHFCLKYYEGLASVKVKHKETYFGYLPCRMDVGKSQKLVFPVGEFETIVNFNELRFAIEREVVEILKVNYIVYGNPIQSPFIKFIEDNYKKRNETKDDLNRTIYKLKELKAADKYVDIQIFNEQRNDCYLITENEKFKNSFFSIPAFSSYITSAARVILLKGLTDNEKNKVVYCDTDSIFLIDNFNGILSDLLGDFKKENKKVIEVNGLKNYKYEDENGTVWNVIKGISKNSVKKKDSETGEEIYETQKYIKTKQALRQNKEAGQSYVMRKTLSHKYDKRIVLSNGDTKAIKL